MPKVQPTLYLPHGAGPCFFMDWNMGPPDTWDRMAEWLRGIPASLPEAPTAMLVVSAHWEQPVHTVTSNRAPPLLYDYSGFPQHTYEIAWPAPGSPSLSTRVMELLSAAGIESSADDSRGFDHGVFIPMKLGYPGADVPTVQLSLKTGLDAAEHLALGRALQPLRSEGVFIVGSGMSYHNMRGFGQASSLEASRQFDAWLAETVTLEASARDARLRDWKQGPSATACHPREEHLIPLMVCAGAAGDDRGVRVFDDQVMSVAVSAHRFG